EQLVARLHFEAQLASVKNQESTHRKALRGEYILATRARNNAAPTHCHVSRSAIKQLDKERWATPSRNFVEAQVFLGRDRGPRHREHFGREQEFRIGWRSVQGLKSKHIATGQQTGAEST